MTTFLYGVAGTLMVLALLAGGFGIGWKAHAAFVKHTRPVAEPLGERERRKLEDQQHSFHMIQNYSTERAYGLVKDFIDSEEGGDG